MAQSVLDQAEVELAASERVVKDLRAKLERAEQEVQGWREFLSRGQRLASGGRSRQLAASGIVSVKRGTLIGDVACFLKKTGRPMSLTEISESTEVKKHNRGQKNFRITVNAGIWRRLSDLFQKTEDGFALRTQDFEVRE
jgi:hypothetical protein